MTGREGPIGPPDAAASSHDLSTKVAGKVDAELRLSADALRELFALSADWVWETDSEDRYTHISAGGLEALGLARERILGRSQVQLLKAGAHSGSKVEQHVADRQAHRPFRDFVLTSSFFPEAARYVCISGNPVFDPNGNFVGYRGTGRNVTAMSDAFSETAEATPAVDATSGGGRLEPEQGQADRIVAALDVLDDAFCFYDGDDRVVLFNEAMGKVYPGLVDVIVPGVSFAEILDAGLARNSFDTGGMPPDEWRSAVLAERRRRRNSQSTLRLTDGRSVLRRDVMTNDGGLIGLCTDVTGLRRSEEALVEASRKGKAALDDLRRTIDAMNMGVVILDADMRAESINRAFYDIWNVTPDDVGVGSPFRDLMEVNRHNRIYDVQDDQWEDYVAYRLDEISLGSVPPRELRRADGRTLIYSVTELTGGKRLISYFDISDQKNREAELAHALERTGLAEAVMNGVRDPIFVKDSQLRFVYVNDAFAALFGVKPAQMIGKQGSHFVTPAEAARFEVSERQVLKSGEHYEVEEDFVTAGFEKSRVVRKSRVTTQSGNDYVVGFLFDVTDIKRREVEAEEARRRLENVLESLPAGVVIYDRHNRFVLSNNLIRDSLPKMAHEMVPGRPLRKAIEAAHAAGYFRVTDDPELDALYDLDPAAWVEGYCRRFDRRNVVSERHGDNARWQQVFDTRTADGTYIGVRVDITDLKEREAALTASMRENELFRNLVDNVPVAIYAKHQDLKLAYVNRGWADLTGIPAEAAIGRTDAEVFGPQGEAFMDGDRHVLATRAPFEIEEEATAPDGTRRNQIARKSVMEASDGSIYLIGSTTDVTELKQRERELEEASRRAVLADRAKSEFLANMSHEIRTPMNGVLGMAELLAKSTLDPKQRTFTDIIVKSGNALLTIINDILDFSKIDAGQLTLDPVPFNLAEAISDVATLVSARAKEKDLELIVRIRPDLPDMFIGDVGRIRQIVTNLLGNAVKFTDHGHVLIDVDGLTVEGSTRLRIAVTDTGIGIPEDKLKVVFEKFSQVDGSSTRRHEGTGLGLAITSRLIELMNGHIDVESIEGQGSTFTVELELPVSESQPRQRVAPLDVTGARILVVDDNAVNRSILMEQMSSWGFDACAAESGDEGYRVLETAARMGIDVDCVILDYQMPGMNGTDVARLVRANPALAHSPMIMLTSVDQSLSSSLARDLGIETQLIKPARSSMLLDAIVTTIQRRRSLSQAPAAETRPAAEVAAQKPAAQRRRKAQVEPACIDILVAEDNEVNQLVFRQILGETDYTFEIVDNGSLAVDSFETLRPRMVLMDVSMPVMGGLEATAEIRRREAADGTHVPIVGVTAHALKGDRERCLQAGMDDYLPKPISPNALLSKVDLWLAVTDNERSATA